MGYVGMRNVELSLNDLTPSEAKAVASVAEFHPPGGSGGSGSEGHTEESPESLATMQQALLPASDHLDELASTQENKEVQPREDFSRGHGHIVILFASIAMFCGGIYYCTMRQRPYDDEDDLFETMLNQ